MRQFGERAVVMGGGIAGLLAAFVLAERFAKVTVAERDPAGTSPRRGVPQGRHVHGLLPGGLRVLEELMPGFTHDMIDRGALTGDILGNVRWHVRGRRLPQADIGVRALSASRGLIETAIRDRVEALPNVTIHDGCAVTGLRLAPDGKGVDGVRLGDEFTGADLVIDATGRGSRTLRWLGRLGFAPPPADVTKIDLRYVSQPFAAPPEILGRDLMVAIGRLPRQRRSGIMQRIETGHVLVTLAGIRGERPPLDPQGFAEYATSLPAADIADLIRIGRPLRPPAQFHCPAYTRQRFERLTGFPSGLLFTGDSICGLNPMLAEGITVAARMAAILARHLDDPAEYYRAVASTLDGDGAERPTAQQLAAVERAAPDDIAVATAYVRVMALIDPPSALLGLARSSSST